MAVTPVLMHYMIIPGIILYIASLILFKRPLHLSRFCCFYPFLKSDGRNQRLEDSDGLDLPIDENLLQKYKEGSANNKGKGPVGRIVSRKERNTTRPNLSTRI